MIQVIPRSKRYMTNLKQRNTRGRVLREELGFNSPLANEWNRVEFDRFVRRLERKRKKGKETFRPNWLKREWKTRRPRGSFFKGRNRRLHRPREARCIEVACVFSKYREIWSKRRCYSGAIVIYEGGRLDQLIGPIEIIFLLPGGGKVCGAHASIRNCGGRTQKRRSD